MNVGDRVKIIDYPRHDPDYDLLIGNTGTVTVVNPRLDMCSVCIDNAKGPHGTTWTFFTREVEII